MIFYTSVAVGKSPPTHASRWAATSDDLLVTWVTSPGNPILSEHLHQGARIYDWRDPFTFYDPNALYLSDGDRVVWGWLPGIPCRPGRHGSLTALRSRSLSPPAKAGQSCIQQLANLRASRRKSRKLPLGEDARSLVRRTTG